MVYHEVILTCREYIHCVTTVDPHWLAELGPMFFLLKESIGEEKMKTVEELGELVRQAVAETLRKKDGVLEEQRLGADLGAESIDRIDLTFRLEEAVGKALDEKILFAEPDPTLAELAARLAKMIEEKK